MPPRRQHRVRPENRERVKVWEETRAFVHRHGAPPHHPETVAYGYVLPYAPDPGSASRPSAAVEYANEHSFAAAHRLVLAGHKPAVLNMASVTTPGGGVPAGAPAQEEDLFRTSDYLLSLNNSHHTIYYPITKTALYSPSVTVLRKPGSYAWIPSHQRITVACIAAAAIRRPQVRVAADGTESFVNPEDYEHTRALAQTILAVAADNGHDSIVLGAIGCGAYRGPRHAIARAFKEALDGTGNSRNVQRVVFAILARNAMEAETLEIFESIIGAGRVGGPEPAVAPRAARKR